MKTIIALLLAVAICSPASAQVYVGRGGVRVGGYYGAPYGYRAPYYGGYYRSPYYGNTYRYGYRAPYYSAPYYAPPIYAIPPVYYAPY